MDWLIGQGHPEAALSAAQTNVDVTKLGIDSVQAGFWPQIDLETTVNYEKDAGAVKGIRRDWSVLLKATWTLFDGFFQSRSYR